MAREASCVIVGADTVAIAVTLAVIAIIIIVSVFVALLLHYVVRTGTRFFVIVFGWLSLCSCPQRWEEASLCLCVV